jgi:hypothetical protein
MKVIIAGSRDITDFKVVLYAMDKCGFAVTEVVSGRCRGADKLGEEWASLKGIPVKPFPAKWNENGYFVRNAGFKRNQEMAIYADALVALWDGQSKGTKHMIDTANARHLKVFVYDTGLAALYQSMVEENDNE